MSVTITALEAENVKRIKAVEITPAPTGLTLVGGNNNQGKTSVLDALAWALGGEKFRPAAAARDGAITPPHLKVTLSNGIVVERRGKNSTLTVTDPTGRRAGQQLLNEFVEVLALDLPRFMEAGDKEKADTLLKIIGVGDELAALDRRIKALYDKRTAVGQIATQKKAYADEMLSYPDAPAEPVSSIELIQQQQEILLRNAENQRQRDRLVEITHAKHRYFDEMQRLDERIEELQAQRGKLQASYDEAAAAEAAATKTVAELQDESTAALEESIRNVEDTNRKVRANLDKARAEDEADEMSTQYSKLTEQIAGARRRRTALLEGADLPLPGLVKVAAITTIIAGITGSASGGLTIALELFGETFISWGYTPEIIHRVASIACGGLDTLPWNGTVVMLFALSGVSYKKGYKHVAMETVILPLLSLIPVFIYYSIVH